MSKDSLVAAAIRMVVAKVQVELEAGRSSRIDAHDLVDLLLAIADEIDQDRAVENSTTR